MSAYKIDLPLYIRISDEYIPCPDGEEQGYLNPYKVLLESLEKLNIKDPIPDRPYFSNITIYRLFREDGVTKYKKKDVSYKIYTDNYELIIKAAGSRENVKIGNPSLPLEEVLEMQANRKAYEERVIKEYSEIKDVTDILGETNLYGLKVLSDIADSLRTIANALTSR